MESLGLNPFQIQAVSYIRLHGSLTRSDFLLISPEINERTFRRYLNDLVDKKNYKSDRGRKKGGDMNSLDIGHISHI